MTTVPVPVLLLIEIARFGFLRQVMTPPDHESAQLDTVCCIREVMHRIIRSFAFSEELADLVVTRHRWATYLDDIHIISGQIQLSEGVDELSDEALLRPAIVSALRGGPEVIRAGRSACIDYPMVPAGRMGPALGGLEHVWGACDVCKFHMGDDQWENIEIEMNSAFDENYTSDNEYMPPAADGDVSMSLSGKKITCMGACGGEFWSVSGTSTHCLDCRDY